MWSCVSRTSVLRQKFVDLEAAIEDWLADRSIKPRPFKWTAKAGIILEKNARARRALHGTLPAAAK